MNDITERLMRQHERTKLDYLKEAADEIETLRTQMEGQLAYIVQLREDLGTVKNDRLDAMRLVDEWQTKYYDTLGNLTDTLGSLNSWKNSSDDYKERLAAIQERVKEQSSLLDAMHIDRAKLQGKLSAEMVISEAFRMERDKWRKAYEALTPGGSEFHDDLEVCQNHIMERLDSGHIAKKDRVRLKRALEQIVNYSRQPNSMGAVASDYLTEMQEIREIARRILAKIKASNV